mmetsp:Transcript_40574/g.125339  ORF Transcript_40574/g.125339 Transcript_40574/m.125339 type:complete len:267 (-) Transcript_40574:1114-1914(-)
MASVVVLPVPGGPQSSVMKHPGSGSVSRRRKRRCGSVAVVGTRSDGTAPIARALASSLAAGRRPCSSACMIARPSAPSLPNASRILPRLNRCARGSRTNGCPLAGESHGCETPSLHTSNAADPSRWRRHATGTTSCFVPRPRLASTVIDSSSAAAVSSLRYRHGVPLSEARYTFKQRRAPSKKPPSSSAAMLAIERSALPWLPSFSSSTSSRPAVSSASVSKHALPGVSPSATVSHAKLRLSTVAGGSSSRPTTGTADDAASGTPR